MATQPQIKSLSLILITLSIILASCSEPQPEGRIVILENGSYFDGEKLLPFAEIIIQNNSIYAIRNKRSKIKGERINVTGQYIIPGLIDAHTHLYGSPAYPYVFGNPLYNAKSYLKCGVTTAIDLFYGEREVPNFRNNTKKDSLQYCTMLFSGAILTAPGGHGTEYGVPTRTPTNPDEAEKMTNEVIDNGMDVIKLVYQAHSSKPSLDKATIERITSVAHKRGKKIFAHIDKVAEAIDCIDVGVDVLAHIPQDSLTDSALHKIKQSGIAVIPTFTIIEALFGGFKHPYMTDSLLIKTADSRYLSSFADSAKPLINNENMLPTVRYNLMNLIKWQIPIVAGTDAGNYAVFFGYSLHHEIGQYINAGMSNAEAINAATRNIQYIFPGIKTGKIEKGYDADMVVLNRNPLEDISNTKSVNTVIHKGWIVNKQY